jgi:hypothetical protein
MNMNMGTIDRIVRVGLVVAIAAGYFLGMITGTAAIVLGALAVIFLGTSLVGTCPLYLPFGLSTKSNS